MERPDDLTELTKEKWGKVERPVLSLPQQEVFDSGYVDSLDEALEILEEARQIKPFYNPE